MPFTHEGYEAWEIILRCSGQLRRHPNGKAAGFDIPTILSMTEALGYDRQVLMLLLVHAELGLREAIDKHGNGNTEHLD